MSARKRARPREDAPGPAPAEGGGPAAREASPPHEHEGLLAPRPQERLLIDAAPEWKGDRILCTSAGYGQIGAALADARPACRVTCWFLDAYHAGEAQRRIAASRAGGALPANLDIVCEADPPEGEVDLVLLPLSAGGEAELSRELIQLGHERLRTGGMLVASTDNRDDRWLDDQMRRVFDAVTRRPGTLGTAYIARKTGPLKRRVDFGCGFAFRDRGRLIEAVSRPGVFAHGRLDPGARALLEVMEVAANERVIDVGCGAGTLSFAAALRAEGVRVTAVDASARAIQTTEVGAGKNGVQDRVRAERNASGRYEPRGGYDLALANPPYFASFKIARLFLDGARDALREGGRLLLVTKMPAWYRENLGPGWSNLEVREVKGYHVVSAVRAAVVPAPSAL